MKVSSTRSMTVVPLLLAGLIVPTAAAAAATSHGATVVYADRGARASSVCGKVSAASVSAIVGYSVPSGTPYTVSSKPTKEDFETSAVTTICTYGVENSMASIEKAVSLSYETLSKALTTTQMQELAAKASATAKFKFSAYSGLGVPAFYFILTESGITGQGITGVEGGVHYFGATMETKSATKSELAALAKLAENL